MDQQSLLMPPSSATTPWRITKIRGYLRRPGLNYEPGKDAAERVARFIRKLNTLFKFRKGFVISAQRKQPEGSCRGRARQTENPDQQYEKLDLNDIIAIYEAAF